MTRLSTTVRLVPLAALVLAVGLPAATAAPASAATITYTITDLGSLGGGVSVGAAINASGQVTGYSDTGKMVPTGATCRDGRKSLPCMAEVIHAFLWSNGTMTDLGSLGGALSQGTAISSSGEVVGLSTTTTKAGATGSPFLWNGQSMTALSAPTGPAGINNSGQIVGQCFDATLTQSTACVVSNGAITNLPSPESNPAIECTYINTVPAGIPAAVAINNNGEILGDCFYGSLGVAIVWTNDTPTVLPSLGGAATADESSGRAISSNGLVVGTSETSTGAEDGFLWQNGASTLTDLGPNFSPAAVNASGVIVGGQDVYSNGTLQNLNTLIPANSGYQILSATGINDNGQIIANATDTATGQTHALLLTPS